MPWSPSMPSSPWIPRRLRNHPPPCQPRMTLLLPKNYREIISLYSISCSFSAVYKDLISDILLQIDVKKSADTKRFTDARRFADSWRSGDVRRYTDARKSVDARRSAYTRRSFDMPGGPSMPEG